MNGITILKRGVHLQVIDGGAEAETDEGAWARSPEGQQCKTMELAAESYGDELSILRFMVRREAAMKSPAPLFNIFQRRRESLQESQARNEMAAEINVQELRADESLRNLAQGVMTNLLMWTDSEAVLEKLFQAVAEREDKALTPNDYGTILEKTMRLMIEKLMEQRAITAMSKDLARRVGKTMGFDETGETGLKADIEEIIVNTMLRNLALESESTPNYTPSLIRRLLIPKLEATSKRGNPKRGRFSYTEAMIKRLVDMLRG